jgi:hypothetical protein
MGDFMMTLSTQPGELAEIMERLRKKSRIAGCFRKPETIGLFGPAGDELAKKRRGYNINQRLYNPKSVMIWKARTRASRKGVEFSITVDDLEWPEVCPVFGYRLIYGAIGGRRGLQNSASLDRVDNTKGYVPGNVVIISLRANCIKRDASLEELKQIVAYMQEHSDAQ